MKRKGNFIKQTVGGENLLVPIGSQVMDLNGIIVLNDTASFLWDILESEHSEEELIQSLIDEYEVDADTAKKDVRSFLSDIGSYQLIQ